MRPSGWALIQADWCPCKKKNTREAGIEKKQNRKNMWRHSEKLAKERNLRRNQAFQHLDLGLPSLENCEKNACSLSHPSLRQPEQTNTHSVTEFYSLPIRSSQPENTHLCQTPPLLTSISGPPSSRNMAGSDFPAPGS